jgi:hypothetical protein
MRLRLRITLNSTPYVLPTLRWPMPSIPASECPSAFGQVEHLQIFAGGHVVPLVGAHLACLCLRYTRSRRIERVPWGEVPETTALVRDESPIHRCTLKADRLPVLPGSCRDLKKKYGAAAIARIFGRPRM